MSTKDKEIEAMYERLLPEKPFMVARVDGRAFSTFTKHMQKPYDRWLLDAMQVATINTGRVFGARLGYTQSDEATFCWADQELPFNGRHQKLVTLIASTFTAHLNYALAVIRTQRYVQELNSYANLVPAFDCRVWVVDSPEKQVEEVQDRMYDCHKNAVSNAACAHFSAKQLHGIGTPGRLKMLEEAGVDYYAYPVAYRLGSVVRNTTYTEAISDEIWAKIPEHKKPESRVCVRHEYKVDKTLSEKFTHCTNLTEVLLGGIPRYD